MRGASWEEGSGQDASATVARAFCPELFGIGVQAGSLNSATAKMAVLHLSFAYEHCLGPAACHFLRLSGDDEVHGRHIVPEFEFLGEIPRMFEAEFKGEFFNGSATQEAFAGIHCAFAPQPVTRRDIKGIQDDAVEGAVA